MIYMSVKAIESNELSGVFNVIYVKKNIYQENGGLVYTQWMTQYRLVYTQANVRGIIFWF